MESPIDPQSLSLKSKLPVKRRNPSVPSTTTTPTPPFKFHRIWTEQDEIRFLQGLLNPESGKLSFPRDLNIFYSRFSDSMSQPYTKSQLSEKLRRLRKKFRVISTRLSKGQDPSLLSPHDRDLYSLSKRLWHPDFSASSPFSSSSAFPPDLLHCVKVHFLPQLEIKCDYHGVQPSGVLQGVHVEGRFSEVDVKFEDCNGDVQGNGFADFKVEEETVSCGGAAKIVMNVFNEAVEEVRRGIGNGDLETGGQQTFQKRWQEQWGAELDVFAQRMRLILENSIPKKMSSEVEVEEEYNINVPNSNVNCINCN